MNIKLRFKLIGMLIALSLTGLLIFQGYWLRNLYDTLYKQMEIHIGEAMKIADYKELFLRIRNLKEERGKLAPQTADIYFEAEREAGNAQTRIESNISTKQVEAITRKDIFRMNGPDSPMKMHIDYGDIDDYSSIDSTLTDYLYVMGEMENMIQQAMHSDIDTIQPIVFEIYRKLLTRELKAQDIETPNELVIIHKSGEDRKSWMQIDNLEEFTNWKDPVYIDYPIQSDQTLFYRLYLKSPSNVILVQMRGILFSSFLLLLLIIIAFIYLLRTILRQKTVEELKTDFTNNMTHELKTPISVSYAAVDALLNFSDHPVNGKQKKYLIIVKEQLTHLTGLVEQILTLAVENRSTFRLYPEMIRLGELTKNLIEQYKLKTSKQVEFDCDIPENIELTADRTHLYNMLSNLIDNAIKYSDKERCQIRLDAMRGKNSISIGITDNGPGLSESSQRQIFDKFYRIPSGNLHNVKGYGLGLYYVKDMMGKHGGAVQVESHVGKGSTFTLCFKY